MKNLILILIIAVFSITTYAQELTGMEVMTRNDQQISADDEQMNLEMILQDSKGRTRSREVIQITKNDQQGDRSSFIQFTSPADIRGTAFLAIEHSERDDDQWLYLPALNRTRRISASDETDNFVGSDFTYEDLDTEDLGEYDYTVTGESDVDGASCYIIEAVPNNEQKAKVTGYSKREIYIRKSDFIVAKVRFFDKNGTETKILKASSIKPVAGTEKVRAHVMVMENLKTKNSTTLKFDSFRINQGVEDDVFSSRNLERGL